MKRVISMLLVAVMCCGMLAGCGKKKVETSDFDTATNKSYSIKGYSFEVPEKWKAGEDNTDDAQFYYPKDGMLQVNYLDVDASVKDKEIRDAFFEGILKGLDECKILSESEIEVDGEKAYQQEMDIVMSGKKYTSTMIVFDCGSGMASVGMYSLKDSEKDYSKDFEKVIGTLSKPLAFERTIDDVENILVTLELAGKCKFKAMDIGKGSDTPLKSWVDVQNGTIVTVIADEEQRVTLISADAKEEEAFVSVVIMALMGVDLLAKDATELLTKMNPTDLKNMGTNPDDALMGVIEGVSYLVQKTDIGEYQYMFSLQRDKEKKSDYEEYVEYRESMK